VAPLPQLSADVHPAETSPEDGRSRVRVRLTSSFSRMRLSPVRAGRGALLAITGLLTAAGAGLFALSTRPPPPPPTVTASRYLYVWASDADGADTDFLAVYNVSPDNASPDPLVTTVTVGAGGLMANRTEFQVPPNGLLMANAFEARQNFVFDVNRPERPRLRGTLYPVAEFDYPYSFARLPNGHVLITYQNGNNTLPGDPGGLVQLDERGALVRTASAADRIVGGKPIRPHGITVLPEIDRALTTSMAMHEGEAAHVVQLWQVSDLRLLATIPLPATPDSVERFPYEPRVLSDRRSAILDTRNCGIYHATGLEGVNPIVQLVHVPEGLAGRGCGVPFLVGNHLIVPVADAHAIVTFDVSDPQHPREISRLETDSTFIPQWLAGDAGSDRIVATGDARGRPIVLLLRLDSQTGRLVPDERFRDADRAFGVTLERRNWPHGETGPAIPRAAVFTR
jgi:hypothetical protein